LQINKAGHLNIASEVSKLDPLAGRRPRILYVITRAERGGAQTHLLNLLHAMQRDFEVLLATGQEGFLTEACRAREIPVRVIPLLQRRINPFADVKALFALRKLIRDFRPDLLHAHTSKAGFLTRLAGRTLDVPSVYTIHTWLFGTPAISKFSSLLGWPSERLAASWCDRIITVARAGADAIGRSGIASGPKVVTIYNGIPDCGEQAKLSSVRPPTVVMVARFTEAKDHDTLLRAFAKTWTETRLLLVGDGHLRVKFEALARELHIETRVEFLGDRGDVPAILARADIFVLASKTEMFPISILEAMRAGLPVISSRVGGVSEIVTHGETGLLVESQSVEALMRALNVMIASVELRRRLGLQARQRFLSAHLSTRMEEQTRAVYLDVLRTRGSEAARQVTLPNGSNGLGYVEASRPETIRF
jgi:glycosyltransferase involved in cell wall biosynthesis